MREGTHLFFGGGKIFCDFSEFLNSTSRNGKEENPRVWLQRGLTDLSLRFFFFFFKYNFEFSTLFYKINVTIIIINLLLDSILCYLGDLKNVTLLNLLT